MEQASLFNSLGENSLVSSLSIESCAFASSRHYESILERTRSVYPLPQIGNGKKGIGDRQVGTRDLLCCLLTQNDHRHFTSVM